MEARLISISKSLVQSAIDAYNSHPTFLYSTGSVEGAVRKVYDELLIGAKAKSHEWGLAKNITRVALIAYWKATKPYVDSYKLSSLEDDYLFRRAVMATNATLKKMIKETNYQRRLHGRMLSH